jgi:hypothetical protein
MPTCPVPSALAPPTDVPTINFLNGKLPMMITDFWTRANGWKPTGWTRVYTTSDQGKAIVAQVYKQSKKMFSMLANNPITEVLKIRGGATWALQVGSFRVKKEPKPGETVNQYKARGGYLLYRDYLDSDSSSIQYVVPSWVGKHDPVDGFYLNVRLKKWTAANTVPPHTIRPRPDLVGKEYFQVQGGIDYPGRLDKAMDWVVSMVRRLCNKLTGDKVQKAAMVLALAQGMAAGSAAAMALINAIPGGQVVFAAMVTAALVYAGIVAACNLAWPDCSSFLPPDAPPTQTPPVFTPPPLITSTPTVAPGSIAWLDKGVGAYRIAVPIGLGGLKVTHVETTSASTLPTGAQEVDRIIWERATKPFYSRTTFIVGSAATGLTAAFAIIALNRRRAHA